MAALGLQRRGTSQLACLLLVLLAATCRGEAVPSASAAAGAKVQSIPALPGCSSSSKSLEPELQHCSWSVQMQRQSARWYSFEIAAEAADNMSVVLMARAVSGQITMALWGPGSDPQQSVPTQLGTNYMEWRGLREDDQEPGAAGGGHASLASEQQYLFLTHRSGKPLLAGQYVVVVQADMGQPLVSIEVNTPSSMTQLVAEEQEALKQLVHSCCPGLAAAGSSEAAAAAAAGTLSGWCDTVGRAVTYDLRQWYSDICHVAPNVCSREGHLQRLVLPPYALTCSAFPKALSRFSRLRHLELSYSAAPGSLSDVADLVARLPDLRQLHLRGIGLSGALTCDVLQAGSKLQVLALSDNDKLSGSLPACWLSHGQLQELQLAGLSELRGTLPDATKAAAGAGSSSSSSSGTSDSEQLCGFGRLKYINMAGVIGDAEEGFTGTLPPGVGFCKELLYLDLSGHALSGSLPALPPGLQFLNVSSNALSGSLPAFAVDAQLQYLDFSFNRFEGPLQDMTLLPALDWVDVSDNAFAGPIPALPPSVRWVDMSNNQLTGEVVLPASSPRHGERDAALVLFNIANNRLTGTVPAALASLTSLAFLDMSHNQLSGDLRAFAAALGAHNTLLQVNLSFNRLRGEIPAQLQHLAAVRPVLVTMKDGFTPVTRIFDVSHNAMSGVFPAWLVANIPLLVSSCQCSVAVGIDAASFSCPTALPRLSREAQSVLRRFESLRCTAPGGMMTGAQQVPVWQVAAGGSTGRHGMMSRAEHKAAMAQHQGDDAAGGVQSQQQRQRGHVALAAVVGVLGSVALLAGAAAAAVKLKAHSRWSTQPHSRQAPPGDGHYSRLPDFSTYHPPSSYSDVQSQSPHGSDGSDSPYALDGSPRSSGSPSATSSSSSSSGGGRNGGGRTARSSSTDGSVEIALVSRPSSAEK